MDLAGLYQDVILDHNRSPRNFGELANASGSAHGRNPSCGDEVTVWLRIEDDEVREVTFTGSGCAISKASASMMTQAVKGKSRAEAAALFELFHGLVTGQHSVDERLVGKLRVFGGVARFPARVKCASLAWHAMKEALGTPGDLHEDPAR